MTEEPSARKPGLLRATSTVSVFTLLSRILGLVRDIVIANVFGVSRVTEAFFVANKIPNMLRRFFAEGAFSQGFVPVVNDFRAKKSLAETATFIAEAAGTLGGVLLVITGLGVLLAPGFVFVVAPGFVDDDRFSLTVAMLRLTFPYLLFVSLAALAAGVLNSLGRFALPSLAPVILNVALIAAALFVAPHLAQPGLALAGAVLVAGALQLAILLPPLAQRGLLKPPRWAPRSPGVRRVRELMLPALLGSSAAQINILIDNIIASALVAGSVSWLYFSDRLMEFPLGVFGIALATAILPQLSSQHANGLTNEFSATLDRGLRLVFAVGLPAAAGLMVLSGPLVVTLFYRGAFTAEDALMTQWSLIAFAIGLVGFMLVKVLAPGFFARMDTRTPLRCALVALAVNVVLNGVFVAIALWRDLPGAHAGLAAATSIAAWTNAFLLYRTLRASGTLGLSPGWQGLLARLTIAVVAMVVVLVWLTPDLSVWYRWTQLARVGWLLAFVALGVVVFTAAAWLAGLRPRALLATDSGTAG
ncbi:MAG: murein biosynthesis integral membrane protein MurJ [Pseudomonadota bacterium]